MTCSLETYLENNTNSRNDGVGITQLWRLDHWSPSSGIGGKAGMSSGSPYIDLNASSNTDLQEIKEG